MDWPTHVPGFRFDQVYEVALELETLLSENGISIETGSALESAVLSSMQAAKWIRSGDGINPRVDFRPVYRTMAGLYELSSLILSVRHHPSFGRLVNHLRLLNEGSVLQNTKSLGSDEATDKIFELLVACLAMQLSNDVELDHPTRSTGRNPDVLASIDGRRWGFACKMLHSTHPEGFLEHLRKGIAQIERSEADLGIVVLSLKNVLPHDLLWPVRWDLFTGIGTRSPWPSVSDAKASLRFYAGEVARRVRDGVDSPTDAFVSEFEGKKCVPALLLWAPTATDVLRNGRPAPTILRLMHGVAVDKPLPPRDALVLESMNWAIYHDWPGRGSMPSME